MKKIFILVALLSTLKTNAQLDTNILFLCKYNYIKQTDSTDINAKFSDYMYLEIKQNQSQFFSYFRQKGLQKMYKNMTEKVDIQTASQNRATYYEKNESEVITSVFKTKMQKVSDMITSSPYCYEQKMPTIKWQVQKDTQTILKQLCQKAIADYKGRSYVAWFTSNIPYSLGPWEFNGLPGLILKISDTKSQFIFEATDLISKPKFEKSVFFMYDNCKEVPKMRVKELKRLKVVDYLEFTKQTMGITVNYSNGGTATKVIRPYNPIDLSND